MPWETWLLLLISDNCVSLGIGDCGIGPPQISPSPLGLGAHCLLAVLAQLVWGTLTPLEAVRARYQHRQLLPAAVGPGRPGASGRCSVLIALCLIRAEELGHCCTSRRCQLSIFMSLLALTFLRPLSLCLTARVPARGVRSSFMGKQKSLHRICSYVKGSWRRSFKSWHGVGAQEVFVLCWGTCMSLSALDSGLHVFEAPR